MFLLNIMIAVLYQDGRLIQIKVRTQVALFVLGILIKHSSSSRILEIMNFPN